MRNSVHQTHLLDLSRVASALLIKTVAASRRGCHTHLSVTRFPSHPLVLIDEWNAVFDLLALAAGFVFVFGVRDRGRRAHDAAPGRFKNI
jgi:hypothetical protein